MQPLLERARTGAWPRNQDARAIHSNPKLIGDISTVQVKDEDPDAGKNLAAVALGKVAQVLGQNV